VKNEDLTPQFSSVWLDARPDVQNWRLGEEFDIWHGDFQDIDDKIEQSAAPSRRDRAA
jgi:hypothetical protein